MPLGMEVGLGPGDFVFDGDPATPRKRHTHSPNFWPVYCGQTAGWMKTPRGNGSRPRHRPHCSRRGSSCPRKGHSSPPLFSRMSIVATVAHLSYCWALVTNCKWYWPSTFIKSVNLTIIYICHHGLIHGETERAHTQKLDVAGLRCDKCYNYLLQPHWSAIQVLSKDNESKTGWIWQIETVLLWGCDANRNLTCERSIHRIIMRSLIISKKHLLITFLWSSYVIGQTIIFLPCDFFFFLSFFLA